MIKHIRGRVADINIEGDVVIDVNGVGYLIHTINSSNYVLDTELFLHTYLSIQERSQDLYGFDTRDELEVFTLLLSLPKIGPKSALQILQKADIELLKVSVLSNDAAHLHKMSGIGKKTAEKIVTGLKDSFDNFSGAYSTTEDASSSIPSYHVDAIDALIALGYPHADARNVIQSLPPTITNANEAVKAALKELGKEK